MAQIVANDGKGASLRTAALRRYKTAEDGNLTILALCLFLLMAMIGAIVLTHRERGGTRGQGSLRAGRLGRRLGRGGGGGVHRGARRRDALHIRGGRLRLNRHTDDMRLHALGWR